MKISKKDWAKFAEILAGLSDKAMREAEAAIGVAVDDKTVIAALKAIADKYGEAAAAYAATMYDSLAKAAGARVAPATVAAVKSSADIARDMGRTERAKWAAIAYKATKQAAADTMLQNAKRDNAEAAWVPQGTACAYCLMLASRGWEPVKGANHAEHIHENCRCMYCVRFNKRGTVEGYDPAKLTEKWDSLDGNDSTAKINTWRREIYADKKKEEAVQDAQN